MSRLLSSILALLLLTTNLTAQIVIDTYKDNERRIQTAPKVLNGDNYILDVYANELLKDTTYILKVGYHTNGDSIALGNKFLIKVKAFKEAETDPDGTFLGYKELYPDTTVSLKCRQVSNLIDSPVVLTENRTNYYGTFSTSNSVSKQLSSTYQVAFYEIRKDDLEKIIARGTKAIRVESSNNVFDHKASGLAGVIKKLYKQIKSQFKKPCLKQQIDNF